MPTMKNSQLNVLLDALVDRHIDIGREDVAWAFESPQTQEQIESWVDEYLKLPTLISRDELQLSKNIPSNAYGTQVDNKDILVRPLDDTDFETALSALEASTAAIEEQRGVLEVQKTALLKIQSSNRSSDHGDRAQSRHKQSRAKSRAQHDLEDEDTIKALRQQLARHHKSSKDAVISNQALVEKQLEGDDRMLDVLQGVIDSLDVTDDTEAIILEVERLCSSLARMRSQVWQKHINNVYRETLQSGREIHGDETNQDNGDALMLQEELDSLMTEISSVVAMGVDHQYRSPILKILKDADHTSRKQKHQQLTHTQDTLRYLTRRLTTLLSHIPETQAYDAAISELASAFDRSHILPKQPLSKSAEDRHLVRAQSGGARSLVLSRLNPNLAPDPPSELLRLFDVRLSDVEISNTEELSRKLASAVADQKAHSQLLSASTQHTCSDTLSEALNTSNSELERLKGALYAYSPFGSVNVVDSGLSARSENLERNVAKAGEEMSSLDTGRILADVRERQNSMM